MNQVYAGLPKPGHVFYDAVGLDAASQVRSPFFRRYLGVENVRVPSAGTHAVAGVDLPRPVLLLTDLLAHDDHAPGGLVRAGPGEDPWVGCVRLILARAEQLRLLTVLPGDQHLNPALLVETADSGFVLESSQLLHDERAVIDADPLLRSKLAAHTPLTLGEYQRVFGSIVDKEDRNFVPHCREGIVEYIPDVLGALARQRHELVQQLARGTDLPTRWLFPDFKTGLSCLSAPDRRGLRGNALREVLLASQRGLALEGAARRHAKLAIVGGTAHEYSVAELVLDKVDLLLMVDNSNSMRDNQTNIMSQFLTMIQTLTRPPCVSPTNPTPHPCVASDPTDTPRYLAIADMHVGVVSSDLGTPGSSVPGCSNSDLGDDGLLNPIRNGHALARHEPWTTAPPTFGRPSDCMDPNQFPSFITYFSGTTSATTFVHDFQCNAGLFVNGCGLESQLDAVYRALVIHDATDRPGTRSWLARMAPSPCPARSVKRSPLAKISVIRRADCTTRSTMVSPRQCTSRWPASRVECATSIRSRPIRTRTSPCSA